MATPYMNLSLPTPGVTATPTWAPMLNTALTSIDSHNHTTGQGVQVPSAGLNINADLPFGSNNVTALRSARFSNQVSTLNLGADLSCLYSLNGNPYWNNGSGIAGMLTTSGLIANADISGTAAIARSKIAAGSLNQVVTNDGSGNLTSVAQLAISQGGTGQATASAAYNALSPTTTKGDLEVNNGSGVVRLSVGNDGQVPVADSTQANGLAWKTLQQGTKNYITYGTFENGLTTGWSLAHSTMSGTTPTSTAGAGTAFSSSAGGSAASANLSISTLGSGSQLAGSYSLYFASTIATTPGDLLISQAFTIDAEDQAKVLSFKFYYKALSNAANGNFSGTSSNTFAVWIYDMTNSAWQQPQGVYNLVQSTGVGISSGTFQTASNGSQYQIAIVCANASAGLITMLFDDISVGPQIALQGPAMTDWKQYTMTIGGVTSAPTKGTVSTDTAYWRRAGDSLEVKYDLYTTGAGANGSGIYLFPLPAGLTIDTTKSASSSVDQQGVIGFGGAYDSAVTRSVQVLVYNTTNVSLKTVGSNAAGTDPIPTDVSSAAFSLGNSTVKYTFFYRVPITGWSSNSVMSSDTDTRVCSFRATNTAGTTLTTSYANIPFATVDHDTHGAYSSPTYTAPTSGKYQIIARFSATTSSKILNSQILVNGTQKAFLGSPAIGTGQTIITFNELLSLNAGDTVSVQSKTSSTTDTLDTGVGTNVFEMFRLSGPAVITATETTAFQGAINQTINNTTPALTLTSTYDTMGSFSGSTYTVPVVGKYRLHGWARSPGVTWAAGNAIEVYFLKNGGGNITIGRSNPPAGTFAAQCMFSDTVSCKAGDTLQLKAYSDVSGTFTGNYNIERIGN